MTTTFSCLRTVSASATREPCEQQALSWRLKLDQRRKSLWKLLKKYSERLGRQGHLNTLSALFLSLGLMIPVGVSCEELNWSVGAYGGKYYDSEPAFLIKGNGNYLNQYIVALTASKTVWRSQTLPLALEIDGMIGQQFGTVCESSGWGRGHEVTRTRNCTSCLV